MMARQLGLWTLVATAPLLLAMWLYLLGRIAWDVIDWLI